MKFNCWESRQEPYALGTIWQQVPKFFSRYGLSAETSCLTLTRNVTGHKY